MGIPAAGEGDCLFHVADRNGDVSFPLPDIGLPPELPERDALSPAIGIEDGRFQAASSGGKKRSLLSQAVCKVLIVSDGLSDQGGCQSLRGSEAGGSIFASHFGKGRGLSDPLRPVLQGHAHEEVLCRHACTGGHDEGGGDRNIDRPDLDALYDAGAHCGVSWLQVDAHP